MATKLDKLLNDEKAGVLTPENKIVLAEARRRNLAPPVKISTKLDKLLADEKTGTLTPDNKVVLAEARRRNLAPPVSSITDIQARTPDFPIPDVGGGLNLSSTPPPIDTTKALTTGRREIPTAEELGTGLRQRAEGAADVARPVLEGGLGLVGATIGAPAGPTGIVAGGALGFAFGKNLSDLIDEKLGRREPPKDVKEALLKTAQDIKTGVTQELVGAGVGKGIGAIASLLQKTKLPEKVVSVLNKAEQLGIPLSLAEIKDSKGLALLESVLEKTPFSAGIIQKFRLNQLEGFLRNREKLISENGDPQVIEELGIKILNSIEDNFTSRTNLRKENAALLRDNLLEKLGSKTDFKTLADDVQASLAGRVKSLVDEGNTLFENVKTFIEPDTRIPTPETRKISSELLQKELNLPAGQQDQNLIQTLTELSGENLIPPNLQGLPDAAKEEVVSQLMKSRTWEGTDAIRRNFDSSAAAFDQALKAGVSGLTGFGSETAGKFKILSKAIRQDMDNFANTQGGAIKIAHDKAKGFWKEWIIGTTRQPPIKKFLLNEGTEKFIQTFFRPGDQTNIRTVKKALGPELFERAKKSFVKKILQSEDIGKELSKFGDDTLGEIFTTNQLRKLKASDALIKRELSGTQFDGLIIDDPFFKTMIQSLRKSPQKIIDLAIRPNNTQSITKLKSILSADEFNDLRVGFLEKIMDVNKFGFFSPARFSTLINTFGDDTLKTLLGEQTFKGIKDLGEVALKTQGPERLAGNPSGTAQNIISATSLGALFTNPVKGTRMAITWNMLGRLYSSDTGRKLLKEGLQTSIDSRNTKIQTWQKLLERAAVGGLTVASSEENVNNITLPTIQTQTQNTKPTLQL